MSNPSGNGDYAGFIAIDSTYMYDTDATKVLVLVTVSGV